MKFVDIHTHAAWDPDNIQIKDLSQESLTDIRLNGYYSMGIHPWFVQEETLEHELQKIEKLIQDTSFLAIGECGLDKACQTDFRYQIEAFKRQISLSEKHKKPLIIHVVKAFNEIILLRQEFKAKQAWIIHGFNGSPEVASQLIGLGIFISFGFRLKEGSSKASKSFQTIPIKHLFLETDNSELSIEEVYLIATQRLNLTLEQLQSQLLLNFQELFF